MTTIASFKANMAGGGARPNQFRVSILFPAGVAGDTNTTSILCKAASLPASTVEDIITAYRGRPVHFAGERTFQPWTISIYNDTNFFVRNAFEQWSNLVLNYGATNGSVLPLIYQTDMLVEQLDRNDNVIKTYQFFDAYPTSIGPIQLDYEQNNQIEMFDVEFTYNYFIPA